MDSETKAVTTIVVSGFVCLIFIAFAGKGCQQSDNKVRLQAVEKECLILHDAQYDCRGAK